MPTMRYDAEHKERTRQRVLKEAAAAMRRDGPDRIAVATIMASAGLTHGGFYAHFGSKDELLVEAISQMFAETAGQVAGLLSDKSPADGLRAYIVSYLSAEHRDQRGIGCPLPALAADLPRLGAPAREAFEYGAARLTTLIADCLQAMGHADPGSLAVSVLSELVGAMVLARSIAGEAPSAAILSASCRSLMVRLQLH